MYRWNNATEQQSFSRVYRIGQKNETSMLQLVVENSIDEKLEMVKEAKQKRLDAFGDESSWRKLSAKEKMSVFGTVVYDADGEMQILEDDDDDNTEDAQA